MNLTAALFGTRAVRFASDAPPSPALSRSLAALAEALAGRPGVLDVAIGYTEVVAYAADPAGAAALQAQPLDLPQVTAGQHACHDIAVDYCGDDLTAVATACGFSEDEVIRRHSDAEYTVAMIGFKPHFPYLLGLDPALTLPRRDTPRLQVRAGAVAIAAGQAGIYPGVSPGGWQVLGYCDPALCESLKPGDTVKFRQKA